MASTNKTTNYELSQYVGTDKPTYLGDYNSDMSKIDTAIHGVNTKADGNAGDIDIIEGNIGTLSSLTTTEKSNLVGAINEINTNSTNNTTNIGTLSLLDTTDKSTLVNAINELYEEVNNEVEHTIGAGSSSVNIASQTVIERDKICYFHTQLNLSSNLSINSKLATGFPIPEHDNYPITIQSVNNPSFRAARISSNGDLYTSSSFTSGDILVVSGCYLIGTPQQ